MDQLRLKLMAVLVSWVRIPGARRFASDRNLRGLFSGVRVGLSRFRAGATLAQRMVLTAEPPKSVAGRPLDPLNLAKPKPFWPCPVLSSQYISTSTSETPFQTGSIPGLRHKRLCPLKNREDQFFGFESECAELIARLTVENRQERCSSCFTHFSVGTARVVKFTDDLQPSRWQG